MNERIKKDIRRAYDQKVTERANKRVAQWKLALNQKFLTRLQDEKLNYLLEVGAGTGVNGAFFKENGLRVVCTDLSPAMVAHMKSQGLDAMEMDFQSLDFPDETFEAGYAMNCLLHIPHQAFIPALRSVSRVLKPSGLFFLGQWGGIDREAPWDDDHYEPKRFFGLFTNAQIQEKVSQVFEVISFETIEDPSASGGLHFQAFTLRRKENQDGET